MGHSLRLFVGPAVALRIFEKASRNVRYYRLTPGADLLVVPLDDDLQDAIHDISGTGDWLEAGPRISTGDMDFAARASKGAAVAYVETEYFGGVGDQSAVLWKGGQLALGPLTMDSASAGRPRSLWPINAVLRGLGIRIEPENAFDEFEAFGLGLYRSHDDIADRAIPVRL